MKRIAVRLARVRRSPTMFGWLSEASARASRSKRRQAVRIAGEVIGQDLHRDLAPELGVAGAVNLAHAACPDRRDDLVRAETRAGGQRHAGSGNSRLDRRGRELVGERVQRARQLAGQAVAEAVEEGADLRDLGRPLVAVHAQQRVRRRRARGSSPSRFSASGRGHEADRRLRRPRPCPSRGRSSTAARAGSRRSRARGSGRRRRCGTS